MEFSQPGSFQAIDHTGLDYSKLWSQCEWAQSPTPPSSRGGLNKKFLNEKVFK